jgi:MHS family proline/betaine transporter-like MFS transporter
MSNKKITYNVLIAVLLGNTFEFYCFILFIVLSPYIAKSFFSSIDGNYSQILTYAISLCGYLSRPFGAIVLGAISDVFSRKKALSISVLATGIVTFLIGIIPTSSHIGLTAVISLILLKFVQGFLVSGEEGGAAVYLREVIDKKKRCLIGALVLSSVFMGILLGRLGCNIVETLVSKEFMIDFGWRIPFVLALPMAFIINSLRKKVPEVKWQNGIEKQSNLISNPIKGLFANYKADILKLIICCGAYSSLTCLMMVYLPSELKEHVSSMFFTLGIGLMMVLLPFFGLIGDIFSPKKILISGLLSSIIFTIPCVYMVYFSSGFYQFLAMAILYLNTILIAAPIFPFLSDIFPRNNRCTGVSFVFNTSVTIFSGAFPFVCSIAKNYSTSVLIPGVLIAILSFFSVIAVVNSNSYLES